MPGGKNLSGKCGKLRMGASDFADVGRWESSLSSNNKSFAHSGSNGHDVTLDGNRNGTLTFDVILHTEDELWKRVKIGDLVTLNAYEHKNRQPWIFPCRIATMSETVNIRDGGEITQAVTANLHGAWTYPDGTVSNPCA